MADIVFSFDTEDFVNKDAAEGILRCANLLDKHSVVGSFNVVALLALALKEWHREDIIEALKSHEITSHSYGHSIHPTICEYTDTEDFNEGLEEFLKREGEAAEILKTVFEKDYLPAACPPGISTSYLAHYGYAKMGIKVYDGDFATDMKRLRPVHFCNVLAIDYTWGLEDYLFTMSKEEIKKALHEVTDGKELVVFWHHPAMAYVSEFYDELNYKGVNTEPENWVMSTPRSKEDIERFYENFDYLLTLIKEDPNLRLTTYEELGQKHNGGVRRITKNTIPHLRKQLSESLFPVTLPDSYCLTDMMFACRDLLIGKKEHICGDVYGFLNTPYAITEPTTVTKEKMVESASQIKDDFLPTEIKVGNKVLGPADWLRAAMDVICGEDEVTVSPAPWQIDLNEFPRIKNCTYKGWMHHKDFPDKYLSDRYRLQSWTIRFDRGTPRKVFD